MHEITLNLTLDDTNLVLEGLGNLPFARVYALIAKVQAQASEQVKRSVAGDGASAPTDTVTPGR